MSRDSAIQWTDATWNPWYGCAKVSAGCDHCYMFRWAAMAGRDPETVTRSKTKFREPLAWREPKMVFTCSLSDFFHADADPWRAEAWEIIKATPQHTYQILTKRPARIARHLPADWGDGYPNVWLGASAENQEWLDRRVPVLLSVPAVVHFVSAEPLLGPLNFSGYVSLNGQCFNRAGLTSALDWIIVGGESGAMDKVREFDPAWARQIIAQGQRCGAAVFVKQLGRKVTGLTLNDSHGGDMREWPEDLRVRDMPLTIAGPR